METVLDMAKKKTKAKAEPSRVRDAVTFIRSSAAWKRAVERFADWDRATSVSELFDRAIVAYAREREYGEPIPKR